MDVISKILTSQVTVKKPDGREYKNVPANVESEKNKIIIVDVTIPIEDNDRIIHQRPNGTSVEFIVIDANLVEPPKMSSFPVSYILTVKKKNAIDKHSYPSQVTYNMYGSQSRINMNSQDNSTNVIYKNDKEIFQALVHVIQTKIEGQEKEELLRIVDDMEKTQGTKNFIQKYQEFMQLAANHMVLLSPFLPALSQLL